MRFPDGMIKPQRTDVFIHTPDIMPTILDFLGLEIPPYVQGQSVIPILNKEKEPAMKYGLAGFFRFSWSIRDGRWSYYMWSKKYMRQEPELYEYDPNYVTPEPRKFEPLVHQAEKENLIKDKPDIADKMELNL